MGWTGLSALTANAEKLISAKFEITKRVRRENENGHRYHRKVSRECFRQIVS